MAAIEIETTFDETGLQQGLNKTKKALSDFQKEVENTGNKPLFDKISNDPAIARIQVNMVKLADKIRDTNEELREQEAALRVLEKGYNRAVEAQDEDAIKRYNKELEKQREIITDLQAKNAGYAANLGNMYRQLESAQGGFNKMGGAARILRTVIAGLPSEFRNVASSLAGVGTAAAQGAKAFGAWGVAIAVAAKLASVAISEITKKHKEAAAQAQEFRDAVTSNMTAQAVAFDKLRTEYLDVVKTGGDVNQFIKENSEAIDDLGVSVTNADEAENLFITHADDFVDSLEKRARAAAYMKLATDAYRKYIDAMIKAEQESEVDRPDKAASFLTNFAAAHGGQTYSAEELAEARTANAKTAAQTDYQNYKDSLIKAINEEGGADEIFNQFFKKSGSGSGNKTQKAAEEKGLDLAKSVTAAYRRYQELLVQNSDNFENKDAALAFMRKEWEKEDAEARRDANLALAKTEKEKADIITLYNTEIEAAELRYQNTMDGLRDREIKQTESDNQKTINEWKKYGEELVRIETERQQKLKNVAENTGLSEEERQRQIEDINNFANYGLKEAASKLGVDVSEIQDKLLEELNNTLDLSVSEILNLVEEIKPKIESIDLSGQLTEDQVQLVAKYNALLTLLTKKWGDVGKSEKKTNANTKKDFKDTMQVLSDVKDVVGDIAEALSDWLSESEKSALSAIQNISTSTIAMIGAIQELSKEAAKDIKETERASAILTAISAAIQIIGYASKVISANTDSAEQMERAKKFLEEARGFVELWQRIYSKVSAETLGSGADYWAEQVRLISKSYVQVQKYEDAVIQAQKAVDKLWNSWLVSDKKEEEARENLDTAKSEYYKAVNEYNARWNEIYNEFLSTTPESLASTIAGSIVDGFADGLDESEKLWDESIDNMMRTALKQQLARQLTDVFQQTFSKIAAGGYLDDGEISSSEAAAIRRELDKAKESGQQYIDLAKQIADTLGLDEEANVTADTGTLAQASQDSIDLLTGIATSIQGFCLNIDNSLRSVAQNNADGLVVLRAIQSDTARLEAIEYSIHEIRETFADVNTRGIKVNMG